MKTAIINITPAMAREWLTRNTDNRPIRLGHVESLRSAFARGEYIHTHQGIAFDEDGVLLDGQHRLEAISLIDQADAAFPMLVTRGLPRASFKVIDTGNKTRSVSDVLNVSRDVGTVATFFCKMMLTTQRTAPTSQQVQPYIGFCSDSVERLMAFCPSAAKTWSASPVKAAVVIAMKRGWGDYALVVYRTLVLSKFDEMNPVTSAFYRAHLAGSVRASGGLDFFVRAMKVFDPSNAKNSRLVVRDVSADIDQLRTTISIWMDGDPKKRATAAMRVAQKSVGADYRPSAH